MSDIHWIDVSIIGSVYEEQMSANCDPVKYRHRPLRWQNDEMKGRSNNSGEWINGEAPK